MPPEACRWRGSVNQAAWQSTVALIPGTASFRKGNRLVRDESSGAGRGESGVLGKSMFKVREKTKAKTHALTYTQTGVCSDKEYGLFCF